MYAAFVTFFRENLPPLVALANGTVKQDVRVPSDAYFHSIINIEFFYFYLHSFNLWSFE